MKKNLLSLLSISSIVALSPIIFSVSCGKNNKIESLILDLTSHNKIAIVIKNYSPTKIENLKVIDKLSNQEVEIDYELSIIEDKKITLVLKNYLKSKEYQIIDIANIANKNFAINVTNKKTFNDYVFNQDKQYFFDLVKDMSKNKIPTIIETRNASLVLQQGFYISLINYYLNKDELNKDDISIFISDNSSWEQDRFNKSILKEKNIWNGNKDIDNVNQENIGIFNLFDNSKIFSSTNDYIENLEKIFTKFNIDTKFDLVLPDINLKDWFEEFEKNHNFNRLSFVLKHVNRIILISDGAIHTNTVVPYFEDKLKDFKPRNREEVVQILEDYQSGKIENLTKNDIYDFLLLKNYEATNPNSIFHFISFINYDGNIKNSTNLTDEQIWNESAFSTNFVEYANLIENEQYKSDYLDTFSKLFLGSNLKMEDVIINGINSWDRNKRNAIFLGSSLFTPLDGHISPDNFSRLQKMKNLKKVVQDTIDELIKKFPPSEYNIMFKLHPTFSNENDLNNEIAKNYIKLITNNQIEDPIIINPKIPLETLIANDYYEYMHPDSNTNLENIFFRENQTYKAHEWTTFFGLQATTTTIHTTRLFYQSAFNINEEEVANLIPFSNFPIPVYFPVVSRIDNDFFLHNHYEDNLKTITKIYSYYCPSIIFNNKKLHPYDSIVLNIE